MAAKIVAFLLLALPLLSLAMVVLPTIPMAAAATLTEAPRVFMDTMEDMAMDTMERGKQSLVMVLPLSMCPRLTMVMVTTLPTTLMVTTLDMVMTMESVKLNLAMVMLSATLIEVPRVFMDTMEATDMVTMARERLNPVMELLLIIHMVEAAQSTELPKD